MNFLRDTIAKMSPQSNSEAQGNSDTPPDSIKPLNANRYATKKTITQGMLDIALLTANASQLKFIIQAGKHHEFYSLMLGLITTSILLQVLVGIMFLIIGGLNINKEADHRPAAILNDIIMITVFGITLLNVVISGFGMESYTEMQYRNPDQFKQS